MSYGGQPPNQYGGLPQQVGFAHPQGPSGHSQQAPPGYPQGPPQTYPQGPPQTYPQGPPQTYPQGPPQGFHPQGPPPGQLQQQWGPPPPSPGYVPGQQAQGDASRDADALRAAMKGFGTNEKALIQILSKPDPLQINLLRTTYNQRHRRDLAEDISPRKPNYFQKGLLAIVRGPLMTDVQVVHDAVDGIGTKESALNDVLLGRSNADMRAIKNAYHQKYHKTLESDVGGDLSGKTKDLFNMVMAATRAEENTQVLPQDVERDAGDLYNATLGRSMGSDQLTVCRIISARSDGQIRAIAHAFQQNHKTPLQTALKKKFDGHMEDALILMVDRACDRTMTDAVQLEDAMKGAGTKDNLLVQRIVRIHWDRAHLDQVKRAYQHRFKKDLITRVKGEIHFDKDYEDLMVACLS